MTDITIKRACEVLRAEGYNDAAQYLNTWAAMPSALRDVYPLHDVTPPERNQPAVAEIAERLAKVEDRLAKGGPMIGRDVVELREQVAGVAAFNGRLSERLDAFGKELHGVNIGESEHYAKLGERITKVAEIIGERVDGLVDDIAAIRDLLGEHGPRHNADVITYAGRLGQLADALRELNPGWRGWKPEPAFPTGGAHTLEGATEAVLPVPQRGDRVRLEGAFGTMSGKRIKDGWYDVIGADSSEFQIKVPFDEHGSATPSWVPWLPIKSPFLKEVHTHGTR